MKCDEFEAIGWELAREGGAVNGTIAADWMAVSEHAATCTRCAGLLESWREARMQLRELREATQSAQTPARVEMRLRQEFRTRHRTVKTRSAAAIAAWTLAAAAMVVGAVSWRNWNAARHERIADNRGGNSSGAAAVQGSSKAEMNANFADAANRAALGAEAEQMAFTPLPGSAGQESYDSAIVRVRMQRGALEALGFPVNEERAADWIQVDLLVGEDGQPQAVRLAR